MINIIEAIRKFDTHSEQYEHISIEQLQQLLSESKGSQFITITTLTKPDLLKRNGLGTALEMCVIKISRVNGIVNWNYGKSVNNQRAREGKEPDFVPKARSWGTKLNGLPFISHVDKQGKHKLYLHFKVERLLGHEYRNEQTGELINELLINGFLKKHNKVATQGTEKEILERDYNVKDILSIVIGGKGYIVNQ